MKMTTSEKKSYNTNLSNVDKYELEWQNVRILANENDLDEMRQMAVDGELRVSPFRSISWAVFLGVLKSPSKYWRDKREADRINYINLKSKLRLNPHQASVDKDDPLSQDKKSLWYQHFCDQELCSVIRQDVVRTFPGIDFFRRPEIQEIMVSILFAYARKHPEMCYRQGMHEILAPLLFVLHSDHQSLAHIKDLNPFIDPVLCDILNPEYLEEDAFVLFSHIMQEIESFYRINDTIPTASGYFQRETKLSPSGERSEGGEKNKPKEIEVVGQLNYIKDKILAKEDLHLHNHLLKLDIPLSLFGIRWLRLLFGREFGLQDLLLLWDAIFAEQDHLRLTNYIVVAMLVRIRDRLLSSDYTSCLTHLMRYPNTVDISLIIRHALHMKSPKLYERPPDAIVYITTPQSSSTSNKQMNNRFSTLPTNLSKKSTEPTSITRTSTLPRSILVEQHVKTIREQSNLAAKSAASKHYAGVERDPSVSDGYLEDDPELLKIELQDAYNIMIVSRTKLAAYLSVLRRYVRSGHPNDDLHQSLDGIEEICSLLRPKYTSVFSSPIPVDPATEANEEKTIKRSVEPPSTLDIQRSYNFELNCRRNSEPPKSYEVPDDKYTSLATKKLANKKEVEMNVFHKGDDCLKLSDSCDLPSIDPLFERRNSFEE